MLCDRNCCQKWHHGVCKTWVSSFHFIDSATVLEKRTCWSLSVYGCALAYLLGFLVFDTEILRCCVQLVKVGTCRIICTALPKFQMCSITMHPSTTRHCNTGHGCLQQYVHGMVVQTHATTLCVVALCKIQMGQVMLTAPLLACRPNWQEINLDIYKVQFCSNISFGMTGAQIRI
jgi:hypothetical protein